MEIPFVINAIFSVTVLTNTALCLLGMTLAVFALLEEEIETESAPILGSPSEIMTKIPFG